MAAPTRVFPQPVKPELYFARLAARLKSCPDTVRARFRVFPQPGNPGWKAAVGAGNSGPASRLPGTGDRFGVQTGQGARTGNSKAERAKSCSLGAWRLIFILEEGSKAGFACFLTLDCVQLGVWYSMQVHAHITSAAVVHEICCVRRVTVKKSLPKG